MLNSAVIKCTNLLGMLLELFSLKKIYRRKNDDPRLVFYHGIGPATSKCLRFLSDEVSESIFQHQIMYLQKNYTLVSLDDTIKISEYKTKSKSDKPLCSISFDDGLQSVYRHAYPFLKKQNIPFTVFLNTSVVNNNNLLWLHLLGYLFSEIGVKKTIMSINSQIETKELQLSENSTSTEVEYALRSNIEYFHNNNILSRVAQTFGFEINSIANEERNYLTWQQINEMANNGGTFYSHTHSHLPLKAISSMQTLKEEIDVARNIMLGKNAEWGKYISFPFGMEVDYGLKARDYAFKAGHRFVIEVGNGLNSPDRISKHRILSRVGLGSVSSKDSDIYTAIEVRPLIKNKIKKLFASKF